MFANTLIKCICAIFLMMDTFDFIILNSITAIINNIGYASYDRKQRELRKVKANN